MEHNILITIKDSHTVDGEKESYEITTHGRFRGDDNNYIIEYDEMYDELRGCHTTMTITDRNCVSIVRTGAYNSEMMIERGKRHSCEYRTPYGEMMIGISASRVHSAIKDGEGVLELSYVVDFYGDTTSENEIVFTIKQTRGLKLI